MSKNLPLDRYHANERTLFITGVSQLLYSFGIPRDFEKIVFVIIQKSDADRLGNRPKSHELQSVIRIAEVLKKKLTITNLQDYQDMPEITDDDSLVDIRLLQRNSRAENQKLNQWAVALAPEHLSIFFPNVSTIKAANYYTLKKRYEFYKLYGFKTGISKFYTLTDSPSVHRTKQQIGLDYSKLELALRFLSQEYPGSNKNLISLFQSIKGLNVLFVFPLPKDYGGNAIVNQSLFKEVRYLTKNFDGKIDLVVVKNHPSDDAKYSELNSELFQDSNWLFLEDEHRSIPIEILAFAAQSFMFAGVESTAFLGLRKFVSERTSVFTLERYGSHFKDPYLAGVSRYFYKGKVKRLELHDKVMKCEKND